MKGEKNQIGGFSNFNHFLFVCQHCVTMREAATIFTRVAQSAEAQKRRCTKILVLDENLDPQHTLFCREISFVANYAL